MYKNCYKKDIKKQLILNGRTDFLATIIELLLFLNRT